MDEQKTIWEMAKWAEENTPGHELVSDGSKKITNYLGYLKVLRLRMVTCQIGNNLAFGRETS